ncbi:hypothetical protein E5672_16000 [Alteromonas portus]|uniref:Integrase n=1 Tax=Alteromonas portus TaxID=2565549 RepID=A0A4U0ZG95_9ALTE|nr:hypothetical protein [Alteromonas portus]TKB02000.1 hypothetical protein E5672_16000 [Alteromonas portus]
MSSIVFFKPKAELNAEQQVEKFIQFAKSLTSFDLDNEPLDWAANDWGKWKNVTFLKAGLNSKMAYPKNAKEEYWIESAIRDFAKAYIRYEHTINDRKDVIEIAALRMLDKAFLSLKVAPSITLINGYILDQAASETIGNYSPSRAYRVGNAIQKLSQFLNDNGMLKHALTWKNPISRDKDFSTGHRENANKASSKLPSEESLQALAEIFSSNPQDPRDIVVTSMVVIAMSAPSRTGELLELRHNCLVRKEKVSGGDELFLNIYGEKGFGHHDKPIPATMADLCEEAINRVRKISEKPRELAKFLEENPNQYPPVDGLKSQRQDQYLTFSDALLALGLSRGRSAKSTLNAWVKRTLQSINNYSRQSNRQRSIDILDEYQRSVKENPDSNFTSLTLKKLNTLLREHILPDTFPYISAKRITKYSEALFCFFVNQLNTQDTMSVQMHSLEVINNNFLTSNLAAPTNSRSIFNRWKYFGAEYRVTSHQFRHYLNTMAQKGTLGELEIARWSGRADISQNAVYNHVTPTEYVEKMRNVGIGSSSDLVVRSSKNEPVTLKDLNEIGERIAHVTLYGFCTHDYTQEPCQKHRDCLSCTEHLCVKGDEEKLKRVKFLRDRTKEQLTKALDAAKEEFFGADKWVKHHTERLERAEQLVSLMESEEIEDGAIIKLSNDNEFTPLKRVLNEKPELKSLDKSNDDNANSEALNKLKSLLGR